MKNSSTNNPQIRICSKCGQEKPMADYYKHVEGKGGYMAYCKECHCQKIAANKQKRIREGTWGK